MTIQQSEKLGIAFVHQELNLFNDLKVYENICLLYTSTLDPDLEKRKQYIDHIYALIDASSMLNVNMVTTFLGRVPDKNVEENLEIVKEVWPPILEYAKEKGVKIAIENCPMWFTADEWPGGQNLMTSPENWRKVFEVLPYDNLGLNYDPSHFVWQQID